MIGDAPADAPPWLRLAEETFPGVGFRGARRFEGGNAIVLECGGTMYRLMHSEHARGRAVLEMDVLARVAGRLPVAVPRVVAVGTDGASFAYPMLAGRPLTRDWLAAASGAQRARLVDGCAEFLAALHWCDPGPPLDDRETFDSAERVLDDVLPLLVSSGGPFAPAEAAAARVLIGDAREPTGPRIPLLHNDFSVGNLLIDDADGALLGVIDWTNVRGGYAVDELRHFAHVDAALLDGILGALRLGAFRRRALLAGLMRVLTLLGCYTRNGEGGKAATVADEARCVLRALLACGS